MAVPAAHAAAPVISSVTIPDPTATQTITVSVVAKDPGAVTRMRFATEAGVWGAWQSFTPSAQFTLSSGAGYKGVFVQVMNAAWETSGSVYRTTHFTPSAASSGATSSPFESPLLVGTDGLDVLRGTARDVQAKGSDDVIVNSVGGLPSAVGSIDCGAGDDLAFYYGGNGYDWPKLSNCEHAFNMSYMSGGQRYMKPDWEAPVQRGTNGADRISGKANRELLLGGDGNDMIFSGGTDANANHDGNEAILGGAGDDTIDTGETASPPVASDTTSFIYGGPGDDVIIKRRKAFMTDCGAGYDIVYEAASTKQGANMYDGCEEIIELS